MLTTDISPGGRNVSGGGEANRSRGAVTEGQTSQDPWDSRDRGPGREGSLELLFAVVWLVELVLLTNRLLPGQGEEGEEEDRRPIMMLADGEAASEEEGSR
jgi:hypothetical protein